MEEKQIKNLAWNTFKKTGDINTFMEFIQVENIAKPKQENQLKNGVEDKQYGNYQNEGNYTFGK